MYFGNTILLQNTLLPYFCNEYPLISLNKKFSTLNYKKYNTHLQPHGILETYNSKTKLIGIREIYRNGKFTTWNGLFEDWYENDKLHYRCNYKNNKRNGLYELWYKSGKIDTRTNYKDNLLNGSYKEWSGINSILTRKCSYKYGNLEGLSEYWYRNGNIYLRVNYKDGLYDGLYEEWNGDGKLIKSIYYKNDKMDLSKNYIMHI